MEVVNNNQEQQAPMTNEQKLQYENNQLKGMLNNMQMQMQQMNMINAFKRLDYLFKAIEFQNSFNPEFITICTMEIESFFKDTFFTEESEEEENPKTEKEAE